MKSTYVKIALIIMIVGLLAACGTQAPSQPTEEAVPAISSPEGAQAATQPPAATDTSAPTEAPAATEPAAATQPAAQGATVSFANDVLPLLESRCLSCHGGERTQEGLSVKSHADLMTGSSNGVVVIPSDAANSLLVELTANGKMPKRGPKLTPAQVQLITDWVNQGAQNN